jgi:hypothetical protein
MAGEEGRHFLAHSSVPEAAGGLDHRPPAKAPPQFSILSQCAGNQAPGLPVNGRISHHA